jgi:excisionase family DNA binding protein
MATQGEGERMGIDAGANYLGVSHWTLRRWVRMGMLPFTRLGARIVVSKTDLDEVLRAGRVRPTAERRPDQVGADERPLDEGTSPASTGKTAGTK